MSYDVSAWSDSDSDQESYVEESSAASDAGSVVLFGSPRSDGEGEVVEGGNVDPEASVQTNESKADSVLTSLREDFKHDHFLPKQEEVIARVLRGESTLAVLPTGGGKTLCWQLPVLLMSKRCQGRPWFAIIIEPLISLMQDQLRALHAFKNPALRGMRLGGVGGGSVDCVSKAIRECRVQVVFVSPEMLCGSSKFIAAFQTKIMREALKLVCVDEAHCLCEWSHDFRWSFLSLPRVIRHDLGAGCVLALTATATKKAAEDVAGLLGIEIPAGIIRAKAALNHLRLSISSIDTKPTMTTAERWSGRKRGLTTLLSTPPYDSLRSVVVYVNRREEAREVSLDLWGKQKSTSSASSHQRVEMYHAGMEKRSRSEVQDDFMRGKVRIVVATIAFGMGIDKPDLRGVVHVAMPSSLETYAQQIGRAGRDQVGRTGQNLVLSHCHVIFDREEYLLHKARIVSNVIDRDAVRKLVAALLCDGEDVERVQIDGRWVVFLGIESSPASRDIQPETLETLLHLLVLNHSKKLAMEGSAYGGFVLRFPVRIGKGQRRRRRSGRGTFRKVTGRATIHDALEQMGDVDVFNIQEFLKNRRRGWRSDEVKFRLVDLCAHTRASVNALLKVCETFCYVLRKEGNGRLFSVLSDFSLSEAHAIADDLFSQHEEATRGKLERLDACLEFMESGINRTSDELHEELGRYFDGEPLPVCQQRDPARADEEP